MGLINRLYIGEEQTIYNGMVFKANQTIFQVKSSFIHSELSTCYSLRLQWISIQSYLELKKAMYHRLITFLKELRYFIFDCIFLMFSGIVFYLLGGSTSKQE